MTLAERALALLPVDRAGPLAFDDAALESLLALLEPLRGEQLFDAARELLQLAHFLDVERKSPAAAGTLLTLVLALGPALRAVDAARAAALVAVAEGAADKLRTFQGDERVTKVLDTGARPEGTTPAGPLARFTIGKK